MVEEHKINVEGNTEVAKNAGSNGGRVCMVQCQSAEIPIVLVTWLLMVSEFLKSNTFPLSLVTQLN